MAWCVFFGITAGRFDACHLLRRRLAPAVARYAMPTAVLLKGLLPAGLVAALVPGAILPTVTAISTLAAHLFTSGRTYVIWLLLGASLAMNLWGLALALAFLACAALKCPNESLILLSGPLLGVGMVLTPGRMHDDVRCIWVFLVLVSCLAYLARGPIRRHRTFISRLSPIAVCLVAVFTLFVANHVLIGRAGFAGVTVCEQLVSGPPTAQVVAITFDDGPDPEYTPEVLRVLREHCVKAAFFLVGRKVLLYPEIARQIADEGHVIGNHSYTHRDLGKLGALALACEIDWTQRAIEEVCGVTPTMFRPPRGITSPTLLQQLADRKLVLALWTVSSRDWMQLSPGAIASGITRRAAAGDVYLFHDSGDFITAAGANRTSTVLTLPRVIKGLGDRGLTVVGLDAMLAAAREQSWCEQLNLKRLREEEKQLAAAAQRAAALSRLQLAP